MKYYDETSPEAILEKALELKDKSLRDLYSTTGTRYSGKGSLGQLVEKLHFGYEPNSSKLADFDDAGVELKTSPIKQLRNGTYTSKERISLGNINFNEIIEESFENSSFIEKCELLLLMFYLYQKGVVDIDKVFKIIKLWKMPDRDKKIFEQDWNTIVDKIKNGQAHKISGSDTFYLEAATTGEGKGRDLVPQPFNDKKAKRRRLAFKNKYVNVMIADELEELEGFLPEDFDYEKESIEEYIIRSFRPYYGMSQKEIKKKLNLEFSKSTKHSSYLIAKAILGVSLDKKVKIEEFEKAGIKIKTIVLQKSGVLRESMSFPQIDFDSLKEEEEFESSYFYNEIVSSKYLFVIFRKDGRGGKILEKVRLWNMGSDEEEIAEEFWIDVKEKVAKRDYNNFWKASNKKIFHVRPKAANAKDTKVLENGDVVKKKAYWLNRAFVYNVIVQG